MRAVELVSHTFLECEFLAKNKSPLSFEGQKNLVSENPEGSLPPIEQLFLPTNCFYKYSLESLCASLSEIDFVFLSIT